MSIHGAVAIDMGASSARYAAGWLDHGKIKFQVIEQIHHEPVNGRWNTPLLKSLCDRAVKYAHDNFDSATVGIDTWGVDHGFIDEHGNLAQEPIAYRDESHTRAFQDFAGHHRRLFELTGIQHQPFNTIYQLAARKAESPHLVAHKWLLLPDLFGFLLTGEFNYESTQSSTTQLVGTDGAWCQEAFEIVGWPAPCQQPAPPGRLIAPITETVTLSSVASHDTASAVCGLGSLSANDLFLNMGTWSLLGTVLDEPLTTSTAEEGGWTNERAHDDRVRFLKNIPGFYIINRLHEELEVKTSVAEWLTEAEIRGDGLFDYFHRSLYNPDSMLTAVTDLVQSPPKDVHGWSSLALSSMMEGLTAQPNRLGEITNRQFERIRVAGGGSQSPKVCQCIADATGIQVVAGPSEATILGNIAMQFVATGNVTLSQVAQLVDASTETVCYEPRGAH